MEGKDVIIIRFTFQNKTQNFFRSEVFFILEDLRSQLSELFPGLILVFEESCGEFPAFDLNPHIAQSTVGSLEVFSRELFVATVNMSDTAVRGHSESVLCFPVGFDLDRLILSHRNMMGLE